MNVTILKNEPMLPVGDRPFWDKGISSEEAEGLQSVADSCVLLKSLRQSRERWLFHTFPKFSSKGRGNKSSMTDVAPHGHHTIQTRGKCDLEIGPHVFEATTFYEAHYLSTPVPYPTSTVPNTTSTSQWHSNVPYSSPYSYSATSSNPKSTATHVSSPVIQPAAAFTPLISSLADPSVPAALVSQVNLAASTNPILSNLLQLAAARLATADQLQTLGLLIQSLANMEPALTASNVAAIPQPPSQQSSSNNNANYYRSPTQLPVKESDLVVEFRETSNERWLIPRSCRPIASRSDSDINLTVCLSGTGETPSIPSQKTSGETDTQDIADLPVSFILKDTSSDLWDTIVRWIGGEEKMKLNKEYQGNLVSPKRLYLGLQLTSGSLLTQLQTSATQQYNMKLLKQGPTSQSRKAARQKSSISQGRTITNQRKTGEVSGGAVVKKRPRTSQSKPLPVPIQCVLCKQTDVPLILGGRFCRPCVESGSYKTSMVQAAVVPDPISPQ